MASDANTAGSINWRIVLPIDSVGKIVGDRWQCNARRIDLMVGGLPECDPP